MLVTVMLKRWMTMILLIGLITIMMTMTMMLIAKMKMMMKQ